MDPQEAQDELGEMEGNEEMVVRQELDESVVQNEQQLLLVREVMSFQEDS